MRAVRLPRAWQIVWAMLGVVVATTALAGLRTLVGEVDLLVCYVPLVLLLAIRCGRSAAVVGTVGAMLAYNYFFVQPLYTLRVAQPNGFVELIVFLVVGLMAGALAARERVLRESATTHAAKLAKLCELSQALGSTADEGAVLKRIAETTVKVAEASGVEIVVLKPTSRMPAVTKVGTIDRGTANSIPVMVGGEQLSEVRIWGMTHLPEPGSETDALLTILAHEVAVAVQRAETVAAATQAEALREADRLKSALLSSVSHDLRTPLAVIKGAASNLIDRQIEWEPETRQRFVKDILIETDRLNRFVRNLLEMSRLEAGVRPRARSATEISDVINETVHRLRPLLTYYKPRIEIAPDLPPVLIDPVQIELVLTNLLENAMKFAPQSSEVEVQARLADDALVVEVADRGSGIPAAALDRIFEKFYRLAAPESDVGGSGLGLSIAYEIVQAHGGRIWATNRAGGGTVVQFMLPLDPDFQPITSENVV